MRSISNAREYTYKRFGMAWQNKEMARRNKTRLGQGKVKDRQGIA